MAKSILSNEKKCFMCGTTQNIHKHHIYEGTANRAKSEQDGCWIYLCGKHHNLSNESIHFNKNIEYAVKKVCQEKWCQVYEKTEEDFIRRFGRSYK